MFSKLAEPKATRAADLRTVTCASNSARQPRNNLQLQISNLAKLIIPDFSRSIIYLCSSAKPSEDRKHISASPQAGQTSPPHPHLFNPSLTFGQLTLSPTLVISVHLRYWPLSPTSLLDDSDISLQHLSCPTALQDQSCTISF